MDKYEYKLKLEQLKNLVEEKDYKTAAEIADTINWRKVKSSSTLCMVGEIYDRNKQYENSRDILLMAYDRATVGRNIVYRLALVSLKMGNLEEAKEYYDEFLEIAPYDNLKYVLRYQIAKIEGASLEEQIAILEEFKSREYIEEWAFELAYLYHRSGNSGKCVEVCDELVLWFGDGKYVEKALELKMLYQPLNKEQEEKYRQFKTHQDGGLEVQPTEMMESEKIIQDTVRIPDLTASSGRFNTLNLQEELAKGMQQIMEADTKETLSDTMDSIKKIVDEIPFLKVPQEEGEERAEEERYGHIETDEEIDDSLETDFQELLAEDWDGQISLSVPGGDWWEPQVNGQIRIDDVLAEWEKTKRAAEAAMAVAQQRKLESAKARALQEAEELMERLNQIIPKLNAGVTPQELLAERYLQNAQYEEGYAGQFPPEDTGREEIGLGREPEGPAMGMPTEGMPMDGMAGMEGMIGQAAGMPGEGMPKMEGMGNPTAEMFQMGGEGWEGYPANHLGTYPEEPFLGNGIPDMQQFHGNNFGQLAMQMSQAGSFGQGFYGMPEMDATMPGTQGMEMPEMDSMGQGVLEAAGMPQSVSMAEEPIQEPLGAEGMFPEMAQTVYPSPELPKTVYSESGMYQTGQPVSGMYQEGQPVPGMYQTGQPVSGMPGTGYSRPEMYQMGQLNSELSQGSYPMPDALQGQEELEISPIMQEGLGMYQIGQEEPELAMEQPVLELPQPVQAEKLEVAQGKQPAPELPPEVLEEKLEVPQMGQPTPEASQPVQEKPKLPQAERPMQEVPKAGRAEPGIPQTGQEEWEMPNVEQPPPGQMGISGLGMPQGTGPMQGGYAQGMPQRTGSMQGGYAQGMSQGTGPMQGADAQAALPAAGPVQRMPQTTSPMHGVYAQGISQGTGPMQGTYAQKTPQGIGPMQGTYAQRMPQPTSPIPQAAGTGMPQPAMPDMGMAGQGMQREGEAQTANLPMPQLEGTALGTIQTSTGELAGQQTQELVKPKKKDAEEYLESVFQAAKASREEKNQVSTPVLEPEEKPRPPETGVDLAGIPKAPQKPQANFAVPELEVLPEQEAVRKLTEEEREIFSYFVPVTGMEQQLCRVLEGTLHRRGKDTTSATGNILIMGSRGSGKTVLATDLIKVLQKKDGHTPGKVGKITGESLNQKDLSQLLKKVAGGYLIIEKAGELTQETVTRLSLLMEQNTGGLLFLLEDTRKGIEKALGLDLKFAKKFTERIKIPVFTSDELVEFAKAYADEQECEIDDMGILALYNRISNIQKLDEATTLSEVKEIVDLAISSAERGGLKKLFGGKKFSPEGYLYLREKDFEE